MVIGFRYFPHAGSPRDQIGQGKEQNLSGLSFILRGSEKAEEMDLQVDERCHAYDR